jgi:NAD(P)-dependent dehydrogenase (short-subunit alcohol dehydrogenase family)
MRDKLIVVTGGFGVLGGAVMEAALAAGAYVAIPARRQADKIPARDRLMVLGGVELTDFAATKQAIDAVAARFGKIDGLLMPRAASAGRRSAMAIFPAGPISSV